MNIKSAIDLGRDGGITLQLAVGIPGQAIFWRHSFRRKEKVVRSSIGVQHRQRLGGGIDQWYASQRHIEGHEATYTSVEYKRSFARNPQLLVWKR